MFYVYVLRSKKDGKRYIGFTTDLERRMDEHNVMTKGLLFVEEGIKSYEQKIKERQMKYLHIQAKRLGFSLTPYFVDID